jgi:site-specific DNA-cytosine methylase
MIKPSVLVACELSGTVRDAFTKIGWDAWSCDLEPSETEGQHYQGDVLDIINEAWTLLIAHPPCTHLCVSGARWFKEKQDEGLQQDAVQFFMKIATCKIHFHAIENPVGIMSTIWRRPDQIIQPWQFGHREKKATCLWLGHLPKLEPTMIVEAKNDFIAQAPPSKERSRFRSYTYKGIADAMAAQWGVPLLKAFSTSH